MKTVRDQLNKRRRAIHREDSEDIPLDDKGLPVFQVAPDPADDALGYAVVEAMERQGGGFVKALAELWRRADTHNRAKLEATFTEYFLTYARRLPDLDKMTNEWGRKLHPWLDDIPWEHGR